MHPTWRNGVDVMDGNGVVREATTSQGPQEQTCHEPSQVTQGTAVLLEPRPQDQPQGNPQHVFGGQPHHGD